MGMTASELAQMQADANSLVLDLSCKIERATRTPNSSGGASVTWGTVATVQAGMAQPSAGQLQNFEYLVGSKAAWQIRFPVGTDVLELDHLIINGETLEVAKVLTPRSLAVLLTVLAVELK